MAYTVAQVMNNSVTSVYGRRLGMDRSDRLLTPNGIRQSITDATSDTTGTNITGSGWTDVDTTTNDTWLLEAPIVGASKFIYTGTTSTGIRTIKREDNSFAIRTSANSTGTTIAAQGGGLLLQLFGLTSAIYAVVNAPASTELAINGTT